jgi:6-phosphogluconolactonase (cycloisomerase 2 family)
VLAKETGNKPSTFKTMKNLFYYFRIPACIAIALALSSTFASNAHAQNPFLTSRKVWTATNATSGNEVLVYRLTPGGKLTRVEREATGGNGTGSGLGNQGGLAFTEDFRWLLAVNAGSDDISVFEVKGNSLRLRSLTPSGGERPVSVTVSGGLVYVLNAGGDVGGTDNISGFLLSDQGVLTPIPNSTVSLSGAATGPAEISFNADGDVLAVTEKGTQTINTFTVDDDGLIDVQAQFTASSPTPFGFAFGRHDQLIVSEAVGGAPGVGVVSSYNLGGDGDLSALDPSVPTTQTAACWIAVTRDGKFAYTSNTGSNTITGFSVNRDGTLELLDPTGVTAVTGAGPIDIALGENDEVFYSLNSGAGTITVYSVGEDGSLTPLPQYTITDLPAGTNGLLAK